MRYSFEKYRADDPKQADRSYLWSTAIGLQAVDGLEPSPYLMNTAMENIEGQISLPEARERIDSYYRERAARAGADRTEEADKVSLRIAEILSESGFSFNAGEYISIHRRLFTGIYKHAGKLRDYNITKNEWVLDGDTVLYGTASELRATLEYDLKEESRFSYRGLSETEIIQHLAHFLAGLWQIHAFGEGNTRTTAVFFIKYLRQLGYRATNDIFAKNAGYFRNALVRANYTNLQKGIYETTEYLELFLHNLLLNESTPLHSRELHVSADTAAIPEDNDTKLSGLAGKTRKYIFLLREHCGSSAFDKSDIMTVLSLRSSAASDLLAKLLSRGIIAKAPEHGRGKYVFVNEV